MTVITDTKTTDTKTTKYGYLDLHRLGLSAAVLMYFLAIIVVNQVPGALASGFYYLSILTGMVLFYANRRTFGLRPLVLMAMGAGLLCLINTYVVGNNTEVRSAIMTASFFVAALMLDEEVDERTYLVAMYLNAMVVLAKVALHGTKAPVYAGSSNNYVSIHLLVPIILYYSLLDARGKKIPLVHSCVVWVLCLMAGGRGGLLAATILVAGVILRLYLADEATRRDRVKLGFLLVLIMIPVLIVLLKMMTEYLSDLYVIDRFMNKGLDGGGRIACWTEYLQSLGNSTKNVLFGTRLDNLWWVRHYNGNLHNSFLFVHAGMGIIGFVTFLFLLVRAMVWAIRNKTGVYLACILTMCFRGLTDHMFGGNRMTAIIIAMILLPDFIMQERKRKEKRAAEQERRLVKHAYSGSYTG